MDLQMRSSSWIILVALKPKANVLTRDTQRREAMCRWRQRLEGCGHEDCRGLQELEDARKDCLLEPLEGVQPC